MIRFVETVGVNFTSAFQTVRSCSKKNLIVELRELQSFNEFPDLKISRLRLKTKWLEFVYTCCLPMRFRQGIIFRCSNYADF